MKILGLVLALSVMCSSLAAVAQGPKEQQGQAVGGFLGNILSVIPGGGSVGGQIARQMAPTIGAAVGGSIGAQLDEEDRQALARATQRALSSGNAQSFRGKSSGARGNATITSNSKAANGQPCRTVKQDVILKNGTVLSDTVSACKGPNGWSRCGCHLDSRFQRNI